MNSFTFAQELAAESAKSQGEAMRQNALIMGTAQKSLAQLRTEFQALAMSLGRGGLINALSLLADFLKGVVSAFTAIPASVQAAIFVFCCLFSITKLFLSCDEA